MTKPLILGMNAPRGGEPLLPTCPNSAGRRLWDLSGLSLEDYVSLFERDNVLRGKQQWSWKKARSSAQSVKTEVRGRHVIVLGRDVWRALDLPATAVALDTVTSGDSYWTLVPHPSGKNLWYNSIENRDRVREWFRNFAKTMSTGGRA